jgi:tetratricopeptide (TPR) repeat protein
MEIAEINEAIYVFSDCIEILENSHSDFSVALRKRAECYLKIGAFQKAVDDYNLLLKSKDQQASDFLGISEAFEELNKKELALQYLNLGIDLIASERWKLLKKLGQIYLEEKNYEEAELAFKKMTFEDKGKAEGFYQLGILYLKQGDVESAYEVLKEADKHFHEKAQDLISEYCRDFINEDQFSEERERLSEYLEFAKDNSTSTIINKISGKFWLLNLKDSIQKNEILKKMDGELKDKISASLEHLIFVITSFGWSIFKLNQEGNRSVYKIIEETKDSIILESSPFGTGFVQEMIIKLSDHQIVICNFGTESTVFDLYFDAKTLDDFSAEQKQTLENFIKTPAMSFMEGK